MKFDSLASSAGPLAVTRVGQGPRFLVPTHGWTCRRSHWAAQLPLLAEFGEVLAPDLPGHGDSAVSPPPEATVMGLARIVAELVQGGAAGRPVTLIGHSMGGAVALEAARLLDLPVQVILVDTFVIPYGDLPEDQAAGIEQGFREDFVGAMRNLVDSNTREDLPTAFRDQLHHDMASADTAWALPLWGDLLRWQPDAALAHSAGRLYAINGGLLPEVARQRCAPHLEEILLEEARHFPQLECTAAFNQALSGLLRRTAP